MKKINNFTREFKKKVLGKKIKVAVVGLGYVGLPLALEFAKKHFLVLGIDLDRDRIGSIRRKKSYITDISDLKLKRAMSGGYFSAEDNFRSLKDFDVILICVPTPLKKKNLAALKS